MNEMDISKLERNVENFDMLLNLGVGDSSCTSLAALEEDHLTISILEI